ncbi:hypothetical protein EDEG_02402 [Edhazardia aedis USNM 41457]|uniref:Uncharacterized protein n=1 Tax=Edhazardia aedis (strain USNM 41457) TaxID=1003232 RepID=J9D6T7_EDHAE|nr:hypothetical protein EDEG_02402 [Edhazardia aedis USNM 41457]|eukprot:EJW03234.1 hypothetical protein EDEG_02402 [Edhazardia aedis USNM 41457]
MANLKEKVFKNIDILESLTSKMLLVLNFIIKQNIKESKEALEIASGSLNSAYHSYNITKQTTNCASQNSEPSKVYLNSAKNSFNNTLKIYKNAVDECITSIRLLDRKTEMFIKILEVKNKMENLKNLFDDSKI